VLASGLTCVPARWLWHRLVTCAIAVTATLPRVSESVLHVVPRRASKVSPNRSDGPVWFGCATVEFRQTGVFAGYVGASPTQCHSCPFTLSPAEFALFAPERIAVTFDRRLMPLPFLPVAIVLVHRHLGRASHPRFTCMDTGIIVDRRGSGKGCNKIDRK